MNLHGLNKKGDGGAAQQKIGTSLFDREMDVQKNEARKEMPNKKGESYGTSTNRGRKTAS